MPDSIIVPFQGYGPFLLYQSVEAAEEALQRCGMQYSVEIWDNAQCTHPVPWTILTAEDQVQLFFAKDKLFEINLYGDCAGKLPNGIFIGMPLDDAIAIDPDLRFDDWEQCYQSPSGYWLEDDLDTKTVLSITIFIPEAQEDNLFDSYQW